MTTTTITGYPVRLRSLHNTYGANAQVQYYALHFPLLSEATDDLHSFPMEPTDVVTCTIDKCAGITMTWTSYCVDYQGHRVFGSLTETNVDAVLHPDEVPDQSHVVMTCNPALSTTTTPCLLALPSEYKDTSTYQVLFRVTSNEEEEEEEEDEKILRCIRDVTWVRHPDIAVTPLYTEADVVAAYRPVWSPEPKVPWAAYVAFALACWNVSSSSFPTYPLYKYLTRTTGCSVPMTSFFDVMHWVPFPYVNMQGNNTGETYYTTDILTFPPRTTQLKLVTLNKATVQLAVESNLQVYTVHPDTQATTLWWYAPTSTTSSWVTTCTVPVPSLPCVLVERVCYSPHNGTHPCSNESTWEQWTAMYVV